MHCFGAFSFMQDSICDHSELVEEPVAQAPPHLEPIVPNSGNGLKTKPFTWLYESESHAILFSFVSVIA